MNIFRYTPSFKRAYKRYIAKHPEFESKIDEVIKMLQLNYLHPSLKTHPLRGKLSGSYACSAGYDLRIVFRVEEEGKRRIIVAFDIGTHTEVY